MTTQPTAKIWARFWALVEQAGEGSCWIWQGSLDDDGYGRGPRVKGRHQAAHRVSWLLNRGEVPDGMCVLHRCDNRQCVNPSHLFLGTNTDNMRDRDLKGRQARGDRSGLRLHPERAARGDNNGARKHRERMRRGEHHPKAVLTEQLVREIRTRAAAGESPRTLARIFGVHRGTVRQVVNRRTWREVE